MKKKVISMLLSITLCLTTAASTGAASFNSAEAAEGTVVTAAEADFGADEEKVQPTEGVQEETGDIFSAGETVVEPEAPEETEDGFSDFEDAVTEEIPEEDVFSAEEEQTETLEVPDPNLISVKAEDWVEADEYYMLRKPVKAASAETEIPAAEAAVIEKAPAEDAEAAFISETEKMPEAKEAPVQEPEVPVNEEESAPSAEADDLAGYYTEADGILHIETEYKGTRHKGYYLFDRNGHLIEGRKLVKAGALGQKEDTELYFKDSYYNAKIYADLDETGEKTPYNSDRGQQLFNSWTWYEDQVFRFYDEDGKYVSVPDLDKIYKQTGKYTGYYKIGDDYFCLEKDGTPITGKVTLGKGSSAAEYYFDPAKDAMGISGRMVRGWYKFTTENGDRWVYYNKGVTNPGDVGKIYRRGITATRLDTAVMGSYTYLIDENGYLIKSKMAKAENGKYYCTDKRGVIYKEKLVKYGNNRYYFTADGTRASWKNMWHVCKGASNRYYYFGSSAGRVAEKKGWQKIYNSRKAFVGWFYFSSGGNHYINQLTSSGYYFTTSGKLAGGIQEVNGKKYLFEVSDEKVHRGKMYKNTLIRYRNRWYYADAKGVLKKNGWQNVNGSYYYFDNYKAVTRKFVKKDGVNGYLDANGKYTTGWVVVSNSKNLARYIDPKGSDFVKNSSIWVDGLLYYFDKNGYRINDLTNLYKAPYYFTVDRINGVMTVYNKEKTVPIKTIRVSVGLPGTPTPTGTYSLTAYSKWQPLMGPSWGQYGTHVDGAGQGGIFVHSVACGQANSYNLPSGEYNKLGNPASHGCIRACVGDAKWVYENSRGGTIRIFDGKRNNNECLKGPLGRHPLVPLKYPYNFDPTDPAVK